MLTEQLAFGISRQPDLVTCGPTCLHAVYRYYGDEVPLDTLVKEIPQLDGGGGTMGVILANHALQRGYRADIYTYNLQMFDPSWFADPRTDWIAKLKAQAKVKASRRLQRATRHYLQYLEMGGRLHMEDLTGELIRRHLRKGLPVLTGLSSTFLYRDPRVIDETNTPDDIHGTPEGHFVVICGYRAESQEVQVADPFHPNAFGREAVYTVRMSRLVTAILSGIITYDANLVVLHPPE